jgi:hypothetical protein
MITDKELFELAELVFEELCLRENGFYYSELAMILEYKTGLLAEDIDRKLCEADDGGGFVHVVLIDPPEVGEAESVVWH